MFFGIISGCLGFGKGFYESFPGSGSTGAFVSGGERMQDLRGKMMVLLGDNILVFERVRFNALVYVTHRSLDSLGVHVIKGDGWVSLRSAQYGLYGVRLYEGRFRMLSEEGPLGFFDVKTVRLKALDLVPEEFREDLRKLMWERSGADGAGKKLKGIVHPPLGSQGIPRAPRRGLE